MEEVLVRDAARGGMLIDKVTPPCDGLDRSTTWDWNWDLWPLKLWLGRWNGANGTSQSNYLYEVIWERD